MKPTPALEEARLLRKGTEGSIPQYLEHRKPGWVEDFLDDRQIKVYHPGREENENINILQSIAQSPH